MSNVLFLFSPERLHSTRVDRNCACCCSSERCSRLLAGAVARIRNALATATHTFFQQHGFLYVHTPIVTCSDCEGAGEMFQVSWGLGLGLGYG